VATGYVTLLRVNEPGGGYGGGLTNWFDADVIFKLHSRPDKGFGFQLRKDSAEPVRRGMLVLLENAIVHRLQVITDYVELGEIPNNNSFVTRVAIVQAPPVGSQTPGFIDNVMGASSHSALLIASTVRAWPPGRSTGGLLAGHSRSAPCRPNVGLGVSGTPPLTPTQHLLVGSATGSS
jgi:hypothetical protein